MHKYIIVNSGRVIEQFEAAGGREAIQYCICYYGADWHKHYELCCFVTLRNDEDA